MPFFKMASISLKIILMAFDEVFHNAFRRNTFVEGKDGR
jgi:hypothetical protein